MRKYDDCLTSFLHRTQEGGREYPVVFFRVWLRPPPCAGEKGSLATSYKLGVMAQLHIGGDAYEGITLSWVRGRRLKFDAIKYSIN